MKFTEEHKENIRQAHLARKADSMNEICERAKQGNTAKEIALEFNQTTQNINKILKKRGIKAVRGPNPKKGKSTNPEKVAQICEMAKQGKTAQEIADHYNKMGFKHSAGRIYAILNEQGIIIARRKGNHNPEKTKAICDMFLSGMTPTEISNHFGFSGTARVCHVLNSRGLRSRRPNRKDGYRVDKAGYLWVKLSPDDPMACMRTKAGIVLEHRLLMARHLGRPLLPEETVHHCDGNKQNNAIENLQLRVGKHGSGQRIQCVQCNSYNIILKEWLKCGDCGSEKIRFIEL